MPCADSWPWPFHCFKWPTGKSAVRELEPKGKTSIGHVLVYKRPMPKGPASWLVKASVFEWRQGCGCILPLRDPSIHLLIQDCQ